MDYVHASYYSTLPVDLTITLFDLLACRQEVDKPKDTPVTANSTVDHSDSIPYAQLDTDVLPLAYDLSLTIMPEPDQLESINLCIAKVKYHQAEMNAWLG